MVEFIVMQVCHARVCAGEYNLDDVPLQSEVERGWLALPQICQHNFIKCLCLNGFPIGNVWQNFQIP